MCMCIYLLLILFPPPRHKRVNATDIWSLASYCEVMQWKPSKDRYSESLAHCLSDTEYIIHDQYLNRSHEPPLDDAGKRASIVAERLNLAN